MNPDEPTITHGGVDYGYKQCKCCKCGLLATCTPAFDFFPVGSSNGPLECEPCMMKRHFGKTDPQRN